MRRLVAWGLAGAVALLAGAEPSRAGAKNWSFLVLDVARVDDETHLIRLQPAPPGREFPQSCSNLIVHARYDLEEWTEVGRRAMTREAHEQSLRLLLQAQATHSIVRLGVIGLGFGADSEGMTCEVRSRGLQMVIDPTGTPVIFSVYAEPGNRGGDATIR